MLISDLRTWSALTCNKERLFTYSDKYVSVHRFCTDSNIDWIIVFSVPQWNFVSSLIMALLIAMGVSVVIVALSVVLGVMFSLKIVKPFYSLIDLFGKVSQMELEGLVIENTGFWEMRQLQRHFITMVKKIKRYRAFIPTHLISVIDQNDSDTEDRMMSRSSTAGLSTSKETQGSSYHSTLRKMTCKFSLYIESKTVSAIMIFLKGFDASLKICQNPQEIVLLLGDVFEQVNSVIRVAGGENESFENDSIIVTFNAATNLLKHQEKAVASAKSIMEKLTAVSSKWQGRSVVKKTFQDQALNFKIAIRSQECYCGNIGTKENKFFTMIGSIKRNLETMIQLANNFHVNILISEIINTISSSTYSTRYIDSNTFYREDHHSSVYDLKEIEKGESCVYELGESLLVETDGRFFLFSESYN